MSMKIKSLLTEDAKKVLSEDSLRAIEEAFTKKMKLTVEAALTEQDDLYASKLQKLVNAIDRDHTNKLKKVVEAVDRNNAGKLKKVIKKYERELNTEAASFKRKLVESISDYMEEFLDEAVPKKAILEATKNKTAMTVLKNLRGVLAVDTALMSESVQEAVVDGKKQITSLTKKVEQLEKENALLKEGYTKTKASLVLESKIANLPDKKKEYLKRVLGDKTPKFIEENFDYTLRLFEKKEKERLSVLKEEAFEKRTVKADAPVLRESVKPRHQEPVNPYIEELSKYK
jgi:hypothetical protein